jgi:spermidine synthase
LFFLISLPSLSAPALPANVILETESAYNQIRLVESEKMISLVLNSQRFNLAQSGFVKDGALVNFSLVDLFNLGPIIAPVKNLLVLGMAGGVSVRQHQRYAPEVKIDAVEIDPEIIAIAKTRFGISENDNLKIYEADARPFLAQSHKTYDMIEIDLFQGSPSIPFYALTQEFFQSAFDHLSPGGLMMMNIFAPGRGEILEPALATIASVFPSVYTIPIRSNFVVLAARSPEGPEEIKNKIKEAQNKISPDLALVVDFTLNFLEKYQSDKKVAVFSDDWAPVELITFRMLKDFRF